VLELFAGSGALALRLAARGARVTAVDSHEPGVRALARAARDQHLALETLALPAEHALNDDIGAAAVIVDPPRRGLSPELRHALARARPAVVVYISCEPETLARDLAHFAALGYGATSLTPFDLMPLSESVEALCVLEPRAAPEPRVAFENERYLALDGVHDELVRVIRARPGWAGCSLLRAHARSASGIRLYVRIGTDEPALSKEFASSGAEYVALARGITRKKGHLGPFSYQRTRVVGTHSLITVRGAFVDPGPWLRALARIGHPVLGAAHAGDPKSNRHFAERHGLDRPFLHLARIDLGDRVLASALAPDLETVLESLGRTERE
jgi:23S rRNA (uracil1939-C5)-methyltransferase